MVDPVPAPSAIGAKPRRPSVHIVALIVVASAFVGLFVYRERVPEWTATVWVLESGGLFRREVHETPDSAAIERAQVSDVDPTTGAIRVWREFPPARSIWHRVEEIWRGPCGCAPAAGLKSYTPTGVSKPASGESRWREFRLQP